MYEAINLAARVAGIINSALDGVTNIGKLLANESKDKFRTRWQIGFNKYLIAEYARCSHIKTLLYRDAPVPLREYYVNARFRCEDRPISEDALAASIKNADKIIVLGTAGLGKSLFMKSLFLRVVNEQKGFLPVFIDLREVNEAKPQTLRQVLLQKLSGAINYFNEAQLEFGLKDGIFGLILDGFDEIDIALVPQLEKEIIFMSQRYQGLFIALSSRTEERFNSWQAFTVYRLQPMQKAQVIDLISKIDFDEVVKDKFIAAIKKGLYERHPDFLSIPLLATMMLLTFEQHAEIPEKMHIFYEQAFNALFHKHDAMKELYVRKRFSKLPIDQFKKTLGVFSALAYRDEAFAFSEGQLKSYLTETLQLVQLNVAPDDIISDLLKSVCILQMDGQQYCYTHRSFQEYFTALFLSTADGAIVAGFLDRMAHRAMFDTALVMLKDMNCELLEKVWIIPNLEKLCARIDSVSPYKDPKKYYGTFHTKVALGGSVSSLLVMFPGTELGGFAFAVKTLYGYFDEINIKWDDLFREAARLTKETFPNQKRKIVSIDDLPQNYLRQLAKIERRADEKLFFQKLLLKLRDEHEVRRTNLLRRLT